MKKSLFLTIGLLAVSLNVSPMGYLRSVYNRWKFVPDCMDHCPDLGCTKECVSLMGNIADYSDWAGEKYSSARATVISAKDRIVEDWTTTGNFVSAKVEGAVDAFQASELGKEIQSAYGTAVEYGTSSCTNPYELYALHGGKVVAAAAFTLVGAYAAYKAGKLSWKSLCALKRVLWTNRSAAAKAAIAFTLAAAAIAVAPTVAMGTYGYMQDYAEYVQEYARTFCTPEAL